MKQNVSNGEISSRQTLRLFVFDLMGIATLLLPPYLAKLCGEAGIYAIILGSAAGFLYLFYLSYILKKMKMDMMSFVKEEISSWLGKAVLGFLFLHCILTAGFCAYVFANLMEYSLVRDTPYELILVLITITASYAVSGGIESRARVYEVLFWFILVPYLAMLLISLRDFEWTYIEPALQGFGENLGKGSFLVFLMLTPLFFMLFLIGEKEKSYGKSITKTVAVSLLISSGILVGSYVILLGNFGGKSLASLRFPIVTLMSTIQFEGNFLKRMDALMLAVWFFTLYALLNLHLHYGAQTIKAFRSSTVMLPAVAVFIVADIFHRVPAWRDVFFAYYSYVAVPFMIAGPLLLILLKRKGDKNEALEK